MLRRARDWSGSVVAGPKRKLRIAIACAIGVAAVFGGVQAQGAPASPITVVATASASQVPSGGQLTYTIVVTNTGGAALSSVSLTDQVNGIGVIQTPPALPQFQVTSSQGSCTQGGANGNLITCNAGNMAGNGSFTVTIGGQVTAGAGTTLNNTATVTGTKSSQTFTTPSNNTSVLVTPGAGGGKPDLTINKTGPTTVTTGAPLTYTLTVNNIGNANATNITAVDTLPPGVTLAAIPFSTTSLFNCAGAGTPITVTCSGGAVNQGQNGTITINTIAPTTAGSITNTAVVDPNNTIPESNELNNTSAAVNTSVGGTPAGQLLDIKETDGTPAPSGSWWTGAGPDPVNPGQKLTYKILVTNNATGNNAVAGSVAIADTTQGLDASSITASQTVVNGTLAKTDGCVVTAPQVKCTAKTLNSGGTIVVTIIGTVLQSAGSSIFNTSTVTGNVKNTGITNTASEATTIRPQVDLTITQNDSPDPVCAHSWPVDGAGSGDHLPIAPLGPGATGSGAPTPLVAGPDCLHGLTYSFVVGNSGNGTASGVTVRDPLPAGEILDSYNTNGGFLCDADTMTQVVTCSGGTIPAGLTRTITFKVVAPPTPGPILNTATVDPNNAIFESDETNNIVSEQTTVSTGVDLVVWKGDNGNQNEDPPGGAPPFTTGFDPIATNGTDTYTVVVDNVGTQDTTGIKVVDTLPAGTRFLSVTTDNAHGFTCSHDGSATGGAVTCVGGQLLGTESEFYNAPPGLPTAPGDDFTTIKIVFFATPFVQAAMHNVVRVDPDNTIPEANESNNIAVDDTKVTTGNDGAGAFNQLTIAKTQISPASGTAVATNGTLVYNLHVANLGTDPVSNVVVKDFLPAGARFISAADTDAAHGARFFCTHDGSSTGGVVTCAGGDFSGSLNTITDSPGPGNVPTGRDIKIAVFAPNTPGAYTNNATVDPDNVVAEGNEFDNDSSANTTVTVGGANMFNELNLTKQQTTPASGTNVGASTPVTYTLTVKNDGSDPAFQVLVRDTLPAGFTFISADDGVSPADPNAFNCTNTGNVVNCTSARIDGSGATRTILVKAFTPTQPGTYTNQAVVDPANTIPEGDETNNTAQAQTKVVVGAGFVDLKVAAPADKTTVVPGGTITYTLTVSNVGTDPAFNVKVRDDLPAHTTFLSAYDQTAADGAFSCALVGSSILCTGGTLDGTTNQIPGPGTDDVPSTRTIEIKVQAPSSISQFVSDQSNVSLDVVNRAIIDPDNTIAESNETNNASQFAKTTVSPAINLTTTEDGPGSASQNDTTTYTITVTNNKIGDGAVAHNVVVVDPLPVGLIPLNVEATTQAGSQAGNFACELFENAVNDVSCVGDLASGDTVTITVSAFVTLESGTLDNEACADPNNTIAETNELDNCQHKLTEVTPPAPDIQINKTADKPSVTAGEELTYTLSVSNVGTGTTDGTPVVVTDNVPSDVTVTQFVTPNGWDCSATSGNNVSCTTPSMNAGDAASIVINTTAGSTLTGPFTNTADVSGGGDTQMNNNEAKVKTLVGAASAIDLEVKEPSATPDPVNHGQKLTYQTVVVNNGTSDSGSGAVVRVAMPTSGSDVSSMAVAATNGFTCAANTTLDASGKTFDCTGDFPAGGATTITAQLTVDAGAPPPAQMSMTVTADPDSAIAESNELNNKQTKTVSVSGTVCGGPPCVDLFTTAFGTPALTPFGGPVIYTVTVTNVGTDPVPDNPTTWAMQFSVIGLGVITSVVPSDPGVACGLVFCASNPGNPDPMDLAPGASLTFTVTVIDTQPTNTFLQFQATADPFGAVPEVNEGNNSDIVLTGTL